MKIYPGWLVHGVNQDGFTCLVFVSLFSVSMKESLVRRVFVLRLFNIAKNGDKLKQISN